MPPRFLSIAHFPQCSKEFVSPFAPQNYASIAREKPEHFMRRRSTLRRAAYWCALRFVAGRSPLIIRLPCGAHGPTQYSSLSFAKRRKPLLAQAHRPHLHWHLSRERVRPRHDDSLFHHPRYSRRLRPPSLLARLRLLQVPQKRPRPAAASPRVAARHHPAPHLQ